MTIQTLTRWLNPLEWLEAIPDHNLAYEWAVDDALLPDPELRQDARENSLLLLHPAYHRRYRAVYRAVITRTQTANH